MKLNHLDLSVSDVVATRDFFIDHFGFTLLPSKNSDLFAILQNQAGFILVVSPLKQSDPKTYPSQFHVGFNVETRERVSEVHSKLKNAGIAVPPQPVENARGLMFYFREPSGILIEVSYSSKF